MKTNSILCDDHSCPLYQPYDGKGVSDLEMVLSAKDFCDSKKVETTLLKYCPQHDLPLTQQCSFCQVATVGGWNDDDEMIMIDDYDD